MQLVPFLGQYVRMIQLGSVNANLASLAQHVTSVCSTLQISRIRGVQVIRNRIQLFNFKV